MIADGKPEMYLDETIRQVQAAVEQKFLFRKIGLPFDYASSPEDFPSKCFATAKEARSNLPNPTGLGAGFHFSCRNHALLFDSYLLRVESGIEGAGDEAILDRLIGGLIRLATVAPKSFLVGGLAPDGRGFYGQPKRENHAAWAFSCMRGLTTAAIAPESQEKFRSIAGKWMDRIRREKFRLNTVDGKASPRGDISQPEAENGSLLLAMVMTGAKASGEEKDWQQYIQLAEENNRARLGSHTPEDGWSGRIPELLWRQAVLSVIADNDPEPERVELAKARMRENAAAALGRIGAWRAWDGGLIEEPVDLDWRKCNKVSQDESPYGFARPASWERIDREGAIEETLSAAYIVLMCGDAALMDGQAEEVAECLRTVPWGNLVSLAAMAPAVGVHVRGAEMGLWDEGLYDSRREAPSSETSFAAKYMEPDYDDENPDKGGHTDVPPGKRKAEQKAKGENGGGGGGHKKRRRRKKRSS